MQSLEKFDIDVYNIESDFEINNFKKVNFKIFYQQLSNNVSITHLKSKLEQKGHEVEILQP